MISTSTITSKKYTLIIQQSYTTCNISIIDEYLLTSKTTFWYLLKAKMSSDVYILPANTAAIRITFATVFTCKK